MKKRAPPKHNLTLAEHRAGGRAHAAIVKKRKGRAVTALAIRSAGLAGLEDLKWRPALQTLARVTLLVDRTYTILKERDSLIGKDGDLCRSIDVFRRPAASLICRRNLFKLSNIHWLPFHPFANTSSIRKLPSQDALALSSGFEVTTY
jgi:hypothetical protein